MKFKIDDSRFDPVQFAQTRHNATVRLAMWALEERARGAARLSVDPENNWTIEIQDLASQFSDWGRRRLNSVLTYLDEAKLIDMAKILIRDIGPCTSFGLPITHGALFGITVEMQRSNFA